MLHPNHSPLKLLPTLNIFCSYYGLCAWNQQSTTITTPTLSLAKRVEEQTGSGSSKGVSFILSTFFGCSQMDVLYVQEPFHFFAIYLLYSLYEWDILPWTEATLLSNTKVFPPISYLDKCIRFCITLPPPWHALCCSLIFSDCNKPELYIFV